MISWSVNYMFLANAAFLLLLALFLISRKRSAITWIFFVTNTSLALWNICVFLLEQAVWTDYISAFARLQLIVVMVFANSLYYFSSFYPVPAKDRFQLVNAPIVLLFVAALIFSNHVTHAEYVDGGVQFFDGALFSYFTAYITGICIWALYRLGRSWRRYPDYRTRIRYFFIGISIYVISGLTFNLILPSIGNYDLLIIGRLSATLTPLFIFYAITKHEFLDVAVIINRVGAWLGALGLMLLGGAVLHQLTLGVPVLNTLAMGITILFAGLYTQPLQQFLLTTAKRKFIRGWYSTEEVINRLSNRITLEKNREALFREVVNVLDEVFELEQTLTIVAVRDEKDAFSYYKIAGTFQKIRSADALIQSMQAVNTCVTLKDASEQVRERLRELQFTKMSNGVILPFHSPEYLEGLVVLGERSNQMGYTESDIRFFNNLISFMSPLLYRLTPMEKLEQLYAENRQKLHEAEIQLIRAQKIESIVHATRQCHHEIRTPLNIIRMGIGRVKTMDDLEAYKQVAREEIDHALEIVEETLTITDVGRAEKPRFEKVNINEVINRCLRLIDRSRYNVTLDLNEVPLIRASFSDMQVVITNLIHNAIDAMKDGGSFAFTSRVSNDDVIVTVEDDGEGIPEELRSKVWEPYFSGHGSDIGNSNAGRGWGLTIVNRIITEHQGTIRFTSEEKVGTRFIITLPALNADRSSAGNVAQDEPARLSRAYP